MEIHDTLNVLYLDDEQMNLDGFYYSFMDEFDIHRASTPDMAFKLLDEHPINIIVTDQRMPKMQGTEFIRKVKDSMHSAICIILTAYTDLEVIIDSVNNLKIFGFVQKPYNEAELRQMLKNAFETFKLQEKNKKLIDELKLKNEKLLSLQKQLQAENIILKQGVENLKLNDFLTQNSYMQKLLEKVGLAAESNAPVLIEGETGTGKELIARTIHELSDRKGRSMVTVNCAALPESLIESELFGHEKGAFTGATTQKPGRFELANNGTLFLDELGELPLQLQPKLLRAIQQGEFERLGGTKTIKTNVRIIAATNQNLKKKVADKTFRGDLFFRLNVFHFNLPPLRNRTDDISLLVELFVNKYNIKYKKQVSVIPKNTIKKLMSYSWPGNVRELENIIERAVITSPSKTLVVDMFLDQNSSEANVELLTLIDVEKAHISKILKRTQWRIRGAGGASELLDVKPTTLHSKIKKLGLKRD